MKRKSIWKKILVSGLAILMLTALCGCESKTEAEVWESATKYLEEAADAAQQELQERQRELDRLQELQDLLS